MTTPIKDTVGTPEWFANKDVPQLRKQMATPVALRYLLALSVFLAMAAWLRANRAAFDLQDWCDCAGPQMTVRVIESRRPRPVAVPLDLPAILPAPAEKELVVSGRRGPG